LKKPLAALLLVPASLAALAVPAGASTRTTWTHQTLRCAGRKSATLTYKWRAGTVVDAWADNRCGHQYLGLESCSPGGDQCGEKDLWPGTKLHLGPIVSPPRGARLMTGPWCDGPGPVEDCQV